MQGSCRANVQNVGKSNVPNVDQSNVRNVRLQSSSLKRKYHAFKDDYEKPLDPIQNKPAPTKP